MVDAPPLPTSQPIPLAALNSAAYVVEGALGRRFFPLHMQVVDLAPYLKVVDLAPYLEGGQHLGTGSVSASGRPGW